MLFAIGGDLYMWGLNTFGQLGDGTEVTQGPVRTFFRNAKVASYVLSLYNYVNTYGDFLNSMDGTSAAITTGVSMECLRCFTYCEPIYL